MRNMDKVSVLDITTSHLISSHTQEKKTKLKRQTWRIRGLEEIKCITRGAKSHALDKHSKSSMNFLSLDHSRSTFACHSFLYNRENSRTNAFSCAYTIYCTISIRTNINALANTQGKKRTPSKVRAVRQYMPWMMGWIYLREGIIKGMREREKLVCILGIHT